MELIRGLHNLRPQHRGCVASIGNFDGVHLGHQAIVARLQEHAAATGLPARVVLFEPQPLEFFRPDAVEPRLMRLREKLAALDALGVDGVLCLHFDAQLAAMPREQFVEQLLIQGLGVRQLVVGPDFRFGHKRLGDVEYLKTVGRSAGFGVEAMPPLLLDGERVSSTAVRQHLSGGDLAGAARLLGRPYTLHGRVSHGDARGRTIGFPTLNLPLRRKAVSLRGVFAVRVTGLAATAAAGGGQSWRAPDRGRHLAAAGSARAGLQRPGLRPPGAGRVRAAIAGRAPLRRPGGAARADRS